MAGELLMINDGTVKWEMNKVASELQLKNVEEKVKGVSKITSVPAWWLDRGDGSDGDFRPTGNVTISGIKQYKSVMIPAGVTVTISGYAMIKCQGLFFNAGTITANGQGASGGAGGYYVKDSDDLYTGMPAGAGASGTSSAGGAGGTGMASNGAGGGRYAFNVPLDASSSISLIMALNGFGIGAGGGGGACGKQLRNYYNGAAGGRGGGAIAIIASSVNNEGLITANGANGNSTGNSYSGGGGGGGGGSIVLVADTVIKNGTLTSSGGGGGSGKGYGATGGTGIVFIKELGVM